MNGPVTAEFAGTNRISYRFLCPPLLVEVGLVHLNQSTLTDY